MIMRRRPLLRAAAVGGGAYLAGKRAARRGVEDEQAAAEEDAHLSYVEQQHASGAHELAGTPPQASVANRLRDLACLHEEGVLTDDEFAAAKAKLLGI